MLLQIEATGPGSDQISYKLGSHPSRQIIRRESESLGRLWFSDYQEEHCHLVFHVRSNVPSIPNRLFSEDLRLREWHRFPEWVDSFLGKILRDPRVPAPEESQPEYKLKLGVFPEPIKCTEELQDFFERADLTFAEEPEMGSYLESLTLKTEILALPQILRRLCVLIPAITGHKVPDRSPQDYARMLEDFRGTWFNVHPFREYITNRFLWLHESHEESGEMHEKKFSLKDRQQRFQHRKSLCDSIGERLNELLSEQDLNSGEIRILNAGDGFFLEDLASLQDDTTLHITEGNQNRLERMKQRLQWLSISDENNFTLEDHEISWLPGGMKDPDLQSCETLVWNPGLNELTATSPKELTRRLLQGYSPHYLLIWLPVKDGEVIPFQNSNNVSPVHDADYSLDGLKNMFRKRAEENDYNPQWFSEECDQEKTAFDHISFGLFRKQQSYV